MSKFTIPNPGERFRIAGVDYEVTSTQNGRIRYSSVAAGIISHLTTEKFQTLENNSSLVRFSCKNNIEKFQPNQLTKAEVKERNRRLCYVRKIDAFSHSSTSRSAIIPLIKEEAKDLGDKNPPSAATVARWMKNYISSSRNPLSLVPLFKNRGNKSQRFCPEVEQLISNRIKKDYLLDQKITVKQLHSHIIGELTEKFCNEPSWSKSFKFPKIRAIYRRIDEIDPHYLLRKRSGRYLAKHKFKAAGKSAIATRILERVEADGNILDVLIIDEDTGEVIGRPYGTCLIDQKSRCIIAFVITMIPFSSATLLRAMKIAISGNKGKFGGFFEKLVVDNGSDYISYSVRNFCNNIGVTIEHGAPRTPDSKPHIERFFKTLNLQLVHNLPGTTFSNPKHRGDYNSEKKACITLNELQGFVDEWLIKIYHRNLHRGHGRVPEKLWQEDLIKTPIHAYPIEQLDTIAREVVNRTITKGRVQAHNLFWYSHALSTLSEQMKNKGMKPKVDVYVDSLDLGKVYIKDPLTDRVFIQADSTVPNYADNLSLFEHHKICENLMQKGIDDKKSYPEHQLELEKWKLWQKIIDSSSKYTRKNIARLKESIKMKRKTRSAANSSTNSPDLTQIELNRLKHERNTEIVNNIEEINTDKLTITPPLKEPTSDSYTFERF